MTYSKIIKLTGAKEICFNAEYVTTIEQQESGCKIYFVNGHYIQTDANYKDVCLSVQRSIEGREGTE